MRRKRKTRPRNARLEGILAGPFVNTTVSLHLKKTSWSKERVNWNIYEFLLHSTSTAHQVHQAHQVQAIIFDLDGTLIDFEGPLTTAVGQGRLGEGVPKGRRVLGFGLFIGYKFCMGCSERGLGVAATFLFLLVLVKRTGSLHTGHGDYRL